MTIILLREVLLTAWLLIRWAWTEGFFAPSAFIIDSFLSLRERKASPAASWLPLGALGLGSGEDSHQDGDV